MYVRCALIIETWLQLIQSHIHFTIDLIYVTCTIALLSGTVLSSSKDDLREMRTYLLTLRQRQRAQNISVSHNPMAQYVGLFDLPYSPAVSAISGFYDRIGLGEYFVANSTAGYFELASQLATNR